MSHVHAEVIHRRLAKLKAAHAQVPLDARAEIDAAMARAEAAARAATAPTDQGPSRGS